VLLNVPKPVMEPPSRVTGLAPMVSVKPELMFNTLAVPGATPVPTCKDPVDPFKETLLLIWTGLFVKELMVTAEVLIGAAPVFQFVTVSQAFEVVPFQLMLDA
jgi:hypothetical protein